MKPAPCLSVLVLVLATLLVAACGGGSASRSDPAPGVEPAPGRSTQTPANPSRKPQVVLRKGGGFYKDDGPADDIPDNLDEVPDAEPRWEPLHRPALKPYVVLGRSYTPNTAVQPYHARGIASWYGKKFHGQKTTIGEPYDMFAMTAAHTTLALPSYVRVTSVQTGRSVVVRVIDRGPFHADRIIDLSYTAAYKLGLIANGSGEVEVDAIVPGSDPLGVNYAEVAPPAPRPRPVAAVPVTAGAATARSGDSGRDEIADLERRLRQDESRENGGAPTSGPTITPGAAGAMPAPAVRSGNLYVQLGAFSSPENAESLRSHLQRELDWPEGEMRVDASGGVHRVQVGPYRDRAEADRVVERIRLAFGFKPTVVAR